MRRRRTASSCCASQLPPFLVIIIIIIILLLCCVSCWWRGKHKLISRKRYTGILFALYTLVDLHSSRPGLLCYARPRQCFYTQHDEQQSILINRGEALQLSINRLPRAGPFHTGRENMIAWHRPQMSTPCPENKVPLNFLP